MKRALVALTGAVLLLAPVTVAYAQPATGPDSALCAQAAVRVEAAAVLANTATDDLAEAQDGLTEAQLEVEAALAALVEAQDAFGAAPVLDNTDELALLAAAELRVTAAVAALLGTAVPDGDLTDNATQAQAALEAAIAVRVRDCAPADDDETTTTTSQSPPPDTDDTAGQDEDRDDEDFSQLGGTPPVGAVETGG